MFLINEPYYFYLKGDNLYAVGTQDATNKGKIYVYNLHTSSWSKFAITFISRTRSTCQVYGDSIYIFGGLNPSNDQTTNEILKCSINN